MELALYHPRYGYYSSSEPHIGPEGDYYTSTDLSPLFGACIGRQLLQVWELMDRPVPFQVVEFGAGKGLLVADILGWAGAAHPDLFEATDYTIVERSPGLREYQKRALRRLPVRWSALEEIQDNSVQGCILSNEVADAFPFARVQRLRDELRELWVTETNGSLHDEPGPLSDDQHRIYYDKHICSLPENQIAEVCLDATDWMHEQVRMLWSGYALVIDYGSTSRELYSGDHPNGTLMCYHRHQLSHNPYERVGEQDITALANFSALAEAATEAGADIAGYTSQAFFLASLGIGEALQREVDQESPNSRFERDRQAIERLISPTGLGAFRVLAVAVNAPSEGLRGFSLNNQSGYL